MPKVSLSLDWQGELRFANSAGSPHIELESSRHGVTSPPQALAYAVMACMAMDVVSIVKKARQDLRTLTVRFDGDRAETHPRRFVGMHLHFDITGEVQDRIVTRAIELSRTTYCSVWNSLRRDVKLTTSFKVEKSKGHKT
jgi:putative redox protein